MMEVRESAFVNRQSAIGNPSWGNPTLGEKHL
jgi:hypothetical protein